MSAQERLLGREDGYTLIETLVALAISAIILSGLVMAIYQFNTLIASHQAALAVSHQVQSAATMLNRDVAGATSGTVSGSTLRLVVLEYPYGTTGDPVAHNITYALEGDTLTRTDSSGQVVVARHIVAVDFGEDGELASTVAITIQASRQGQTRSATLAVYRRPASQDGEGEGS